MPDYNKHRFTKKPFTKGRDFNRAPKQMYKADCSKCGNACEVPFRPSGNKPVFCSNCFVKDDSSQRFPRRDFSPRSAFPQAHREDRLSQDLKTELQGINDKLERLISLLTPASQTVKISKSSKKK